MQIIFITIFILLLALSTFELKYYTSLTYKKYQKGIFIIIISILVGIAGFRTIGSDNDSRMYEIMFSEIGKMNYHDIFFNNPGRVKDIGYLLLNKIFKDFGFRALLIFCSIIALGIKGYLLYRFTRFPFFSLFIYFILFFYLREFTQIRDALATSFILLCFMMYVKKKYFYSLLFSLTAMSFHDLSWMCIVVIILWEFYKVKPLFCYIFFAMIILLKIYIPGLDYLSSPLLPSKLSIYVIEESYRNFNTGYFLPIFSLFLLIVFSFSQVSLKSNFLYFIFLLTFVSYVYSLNNMVLIRIPNILFFGNIIAIGNVKYLSGNIRYAVLFILGGYWIKTFLIIQ